MSTPKSRRPEKPTEADNRPAFADIVTEDEFIIPAGTGLGIVALALYMDTTYSWILTAAYLGVGLPTLYYYRRNRPQPVVDESWRETLVETDQHRSLRAKFAKGLEQKSLLHGEYERAVQQYDLAVRGYEASKAKITSGDETSRERTLGVYNAVMENLGKASQILTQLAAIDTNQLIRKIQSLQSKSQMTDPDRAELRQLLTKTEAREQMLSDLVDALRANDRLLEELS